MKFPSTRFASPFSLINWRIVARICTEKKVAISTKLIYSMTFHISPQTNDQVFQWKINSVFLMPLAWFPKTPIEHALLTWFGPNQTAANLAGNERMKTWLAATIDCPANATENRSGETPKTLIHAPRHVPKHPRIAATRRPCWEI